jgi:small subunit ribosomal protein S16
MVIIRLSRTGVRNDPFYKVVAIDDQRQVRGKVLDVVGFWFPRKNTVKIDKEILNKWLKVGAKVSPAVTKILAK